MSALFALPASRVQQPWRMALLASLVAGCTTPAQMPDASAPAGPSAASASPGPATGTLPQTPRPAAAARPVAGSAAAGPAEVRTAHAVFRRAGFDDLPGWSQDDVRAGWGAFRESCGPLKRRSGWRDVCGAAEAVPPTEKAMRAFFEAHFAVYRILNKDASGEGEVTGYFEPLLEGQPRRGGEFQTPVMGVPRGLYTLDWGRVPSAQRQAPVRVRPEGDRLVLAATGDASAYVLDWRRFVLDDRDRTLRLRLVDGPPRRVEPYYTRAELAELGLPDGVDAPVLAWVNDPLALYAMQVQGSGRILMPDTSVLRLQYAEQNGQPFRPLRVVAKAAPVTRGASRMAPDAFTFEGEGEDAVATGERPSPVVTRGSKPATAPPHDPLVDELLQSGRSGGATRPGTVAAPTTAGRTAPGSGAGGKARVAAPAPAPAGSGHPASAAVARRLLADPSYVFFKPVTVRRPASDGPQGALGVPLTAGRSVAVDPRVTPLGYPVYLSARPPAGSRVQVQRLVFAQDTGGAIRGAVRADYFWGFGADAGQMARSTRHRGQMWVLLPHAEAGRLAARGRVVTRGTADAGGAADDARCLVADEEFCTESLD